MTACFFAAQCALILASADEALQLPIRRVSFYRNDVAWIDMEGEVAVKEGRALIKLPENHESSTVCVEAGDAGKPLHVVVPIPLDNPLTLNFEPGAATRRVHLQCLLTKVGWKPRYQIDVSPGKESRIRLDAFVSNRGPELSPAAAECVGAGITQGSRDAEAAGEETPVFPLSKSQFPAQRRQFFHLLDEPAPAEEFVQVQLGAMAGEAPARDTSDKATSVLRISNRSLRGWPAGDLLVLEDGRLRAMTQLPRTDPGQSVEITLGAAGGIALRREEVELERKLSAIRRENEAPDRIQTAGSVALTNRRAKPMRIRVVKTIVGEGLAASDDGKIQRAVNRLGVDQPLSEIKWNLLLPAGETKRLTFGALLNVVPPDVKERP